MRSILHTRLHKTRPGSSLQWSSTVAKVEAEAGDQTEATTTIAYQKQRTKSIAHTDLVTKNKFHNHGYLPCLGQQQCNAKAALHENAHNAI